MPPRKSDTIDLSKLNLPTRDDVLASTAAIDRVARAMELIARGVTSTKEDVAPTIITNPLNRRGSSQAFQIAATLGGTSVTDPLHIQVQQALINQLPGADFLVPPNQIIPSLNTTPINGISEYRVRGNVEK
jgi:hypothetical protein